MDYSHKKKIREKHIRYYDNAEYGHYPRRIKKSVGILLFLVVLAMFIISYKMFK